MSSAMETLYHETNRKLSEAHDCFGRLERAASRQEAHSILRESEVRTEQIASNCERLDVLVEKEPVARRQHAKMKVENLKGDIRHLQSSLRSFESRLCAREQEEVDREQLLRTRFTTNAAAAAADGGGGAAADGSTAILIDHALNHNNALDNSHSRVDDLISHGQTILKNLRDQRNTIKNIQTRILDVANYLGMSSTVMRLIERRQDGDKYLMLGGMVATCVVMYVVVRFFT